ncbi:hypothetical protein L3081_24430 [Colwellia sp. MSW7]|jgi:hypothetical protein|uniref:Uncharacterized protein n=1 Tax=Colwellia maritima TaxID=2912588 RepID=A0ABS9XAB2_9GAMM|nr:hypothetical protein [Colwellia maritima]MCI2285977.1 hypothetical protein [Colwellia maritima]
MDSKTKKLAKKLKECTESGPIEYPDQYKYAVDLCKEVERDFDETNHMPPKMKDDWNDLKEKINEYD